MSLDKTKGRLDLTAGEMRTIACFAMSLQRKKQSRYLEVGIYGGGTIKFVKDHAKGIDCTGIDLFEDFHKNQNNTHIGNTFSKEMVQDFLGSDVRLIKGDSSLVLSDLHKNNEKFDLIFIDGNHKYEAVKKDYEQALLVLDESGFIAFHNCSTHGKPDWDLYNKIDGGPWLLTTEIKMRKDMVLVADVDRVCVFGKVKN